MADDQDGSDLDDTRVTREWELYQEMLKASKESLGKHREDEEARLDTVIGRERAKAFKSCKAFHILLFFL